MPFFAVVGRKRRGAGGCGCGVSSSAAYHGGDAAARDRRTGRRGEGRAGERWLAQVAEVALDVVQQCTYTLMQRGQREVTNRLNSQAEELARANRILDRVDKHTKRT